MLESCKKNNLKPAIFGSPNSLYEALRSAISNLLRGHVKGSRFNSADLEQLTKLMPFIEFSKPIKVDITNPVIAVENLEMTRKKNYEGKDNGIYMFIFVRNGVVQVLYTGKTTNYYRQRFESFLAMLPSCKRNEIRQMYVDWLQKQMQLGGELEGFCLFYVQIDIDAALERASKAGLDLSDFSPYFLKNVAAEIERAFLGTNKCAANSQINSGYCKPASNVEMEKFIANQSRTLAWRRRFLQKLRAKAAAARRKARCGARSSARR